MSAEFTATNSDEGTHMKLYISVGPNPKAVNRNSRNRGQRDRLPGLSAFVGQKCLDKLS